MQALIQSTIQIQTRLRELGIPSAIIGGLAVALWGEPRLTRDIALRISLSADAATHLLEWLAPTYTPASPLAERLFQRLNILFLRDPDGARIDLMQSNTPFDKEVLRRARSVEILPEQQIVVCSAEDLIVLKLLTTRPRDHEDVVGIVRRQGDGLDRDYLLHWLQRFEKALDEPTLVRRFQQLAAPQAGEDDLPYGSPEGNP